MTVQLLFDPGLAQRPMRVAGFLSGSGTNIQRLIEHEQALARISGRAPYEVVFLFSDRSDGQCAGERIALERGLPYFSYDIRAFYAKKGLPRTVRTPEGLEARKAYDAVAARLVEAFAVDVIALGGYMSYITLKGCINVHPADLSLCTPDGHRRFVGHQAVKEALLAGKRELRASTLWTDEGVDSGPLLMVSDPLAVELPVSLETLRQEEALLAGIADQHQERLKRIGDWKVFPKTVEMMARGRFGLDEYGQVYVDGKPVPGGFRE